MRAVMCRELGGPEGLVVEEVAEPALRTGMVRIAVHAAGVNFGDTLMIGGTYQTRPPLPFTPGFEIAGEVMEIGAGVAGIRPGDRVMAILDWGGYAEEAVVPEADVFPIPQAMDYATAAGFPVVYGTSHGAFDWRARLRAGERVLVNGAAGGAGLTAVETAKAMGATVIAAAAGARKLEIARSHGADHLIDYAAEDIRTRVKALTGGRGADVVYDPVGGDAFEASLRSIAFEGRILVIGFASGKVPQIPANIVMVKNCDVIGFLWGTYRQKAPEKLRRSFATLLSWFEAGRLNPLVSERFDLADAPMALLRLKERHSTGKIVLMAR